MNNKVKIGMTFVVLFFALSSQAKKIMDLDDNKSSSDDRIKITKNVKFEENRNDENLNLDFFSRLGGCTIFSKNKNNQFIKKDDKFTIRSIFGSHKPENYWTIYISIRRISIFNNKRNLFHIQCILPSNPKEYLDTNHITETSNGSITFY